MFVSGITVVLFLVGLAGLLLYPKTEGKLNGLKIIVMGTIALLCYLAFCALVCKILGIFVGLSSTCVSLIFLDVLLWGGILWKREVQRLFWRISDVMGILLCGAFVIAIAMHLFTSGLELQYCNVDAASHFWLATDLIRTGTWSGNIYFSAYVDALIIELFAPLLSPILYFKAFIVADIFMHLLEIWSVYYLMLTISDRKLMQILAPVFAIGYFFGYPAYSFMVGNFVYWSNGVVLLIFTVYVLLLLEKNRVSYRYMVPLLLLGVYANTCCNKLFVPVNTLAAIVVSAVLFLKRRKWKLDRKHLVQVLIGAGVAAVVMGGAAFLAWGRLISWMGARFAAPGGIYESMYADVIFFLPPVFYVFCQLCRRRRQIVTIGVLSLYMLLVAAAMLCVLIDGGLSIYYYYKIYYNLWLCGWLLVTQAFEIMAERKKLAAFFSYFGMTVLICIITLTDYDGVIAGTHPEYNGDYATSQMFSVYRYNMDRWQMDYGVYRISDQTLETFRYVTEEMEPGNVQMITESIDLLMWYQSFKWIYRLDNNILQKELPEVLAYFDSCGVQAAIVPKNDERYWHYLDYIIRCKNVYENDEMIVIRPFGEAWLEIPSDVLVDSEANQELYTYVAEQFPGEVVPLWAGADRYYDYMMYYMATGNEMTRYYPWNSETEKESAQRLQKDDIRYLIVLKDDVFCEHAYTYFDVEQVVFENEAGKILAVRQMEEE